MKALRPGTLLFKERPRRFMSALSQGFTVINRRRPPRPQAGQRQPALRCLHRQIASKQPAACVKKILHSGSAQMNPRGAGNCF